MKRGCPTPITHDVSQSGRKEVSHLKSVQRCSARLVSLGHGRCETRPIITPITHLQHTTLLSSSRLTPHASRPAKTLTAHRYCLRTFVADPCRTSSYYPSQLPHLSFPGPSHYDLRALILLRETALSTLQLHLAHDGFFGPLLVESQTSKLSPCTL
jgi:hypothetical protein